MTEEKLRRVRRIYSYILSALVVFVGICFITSCIVIYLSGDRPFSRESVGTQLGSILVPIVLCVLGILGSIAFTFFPLSEPKIKGTIDHRITLARLKSRCDLGKCPSELLDKINKERKKRIIFQIASLCVTVISFTISLIYCLTKSNFESSDINEDIARASLVILCCCIAAGAVVIAYNLFASASIARELEIVKKALGVSKKEGKSEKTYIKKNTLAINITRIAITVISVVFIIIGISNGGMADVFEKATRICTECIGLG